MRFVFLILAVGLLVLAQPKPASAAIVTLDLQVNPSAKTWEVYASLTGDNQGVASFAIDVTGAGGASVTSSVLQAPRPFDAGLDDFTGFRIFRSNGTAGVDIRASQDTVVGDPAVLIMNLGIASPVKLASGAYAGDAGTLTASLHPSSLFNVFPTGYTAGGATSAASQVTPETVAVPEPAGLALLGLIVVGLLRRTR